MRVTIIPSDTLVSIDGEAVFGISMAGIASNIHAVQWYGENGEIEYNDGTKNLRINNFTEFSNFITLYTDKKIEIKQANPPAPYYTWDTTISDWVMDESAKIVFDSASAFEDANTSINSIKLVDGSGSGLDADLLDGQHGSYYTANTLFAAHTANISNPHSVTKTQVGLGSVDNTADVNKPISTATQTALNLKAPLASPTFTGTVVLPSTTSIGNVGATEISYLDGVASSVQTQLNAKVAAVPSTDNAIVRFDGTGGAVQNSTCFIDDSGNLGIGTTSPVYKLDAATAGTITVRVQNTASTADAYFMAQNTLGYGYFGINATGPYIYTAQALSMLFYTNSTERMRLDADGNVGINTITPTAKLQVKGSGTTTGINFQTLNSAGTDLVTGLDNGNVGIGTISPAQKLDIASGNVRIDNTTGTTPYGVIYKGSTRFIHNFNYGNNGTVTTDGQNTFLGINAGNFSMGSTATSTSHSSYNTGIGQNALASNTTGHYNSAIGVFALQSNTTGHYNSAMGASTIYANTTGYYNSAMGMSALFSNTTGFSNSAMGVSALFSNTTGYNNSAMGVSAGRSLADGTANQTSNNSLFLGYDTRASVAGGSNEIVIGASAIGLGSNTVVLGNDSITKTVLKGNVGIGTTTPTAKLHVIGDVTITDSKTGTASTSITTATQTSIYSFATASYRTAKFIVQVTDSTNSQYHSTEILVIHDGTTVSLVQYGTIFTTSELGTFDATITSETLNLYFTATAATTKVVKVFATALSI